MSNGESSPPESSWDKLAEIFFGRLAPIATASCGISIVAAIFTYYQTKDVEQGTKFLAWAFVIGFFLLTISLLFFVEHRTNHFRIRNQKQKAALILLQQEQETLNQQLLTREDNLKQLADDRVKFLRSNQTNLNEVSEYLRQLHSAQEISSSKLLPIQEIISSVLDKIAKEIEEIEKSRGKISLGIELLNLADNPDYFEREPKRKPDNY